MRGGKNISFPTLGLFAYSDILSRLIGGTWPMCTPSLSEMAATALQALGDATKNSEKGFFLMIEGAGLTMPDMQTILLRKFARSWSTT